MRRRMNPNIDGQPAESGITTLAPLRRNGLCSRHCLWRGSSPDACPTSRSSPANDDDMTTMTKTTTSNVTIMASRVAKNLSSYRAPLEHEALEKQLTVGSLSCHTSPSCTSPSTSTNVFHTPVFSKTSKPGRSLYDPSSPRPDMCALVSTCIE